MQSANHFTLRIKKVLPADPLLTATVTIAIVFLPAAFIGCGSSPPDDERRALYEDDFWASASEADVNAELERDPDLSATVGELGLSPLHVAASHTKNPAIISLLLDSGADIGIRSGLNNSTPLHMAASFNTEPAVIELLLDRGADIEAVNNRQARPLHVATALNANREVAVLLLSRGADPSASVGDGASALHTAAFNREVGMVVLMLEHGGDVALRSLSGRTALHTAALHNPNPKCIRSSWSMGPTFPPRITKA